MAKQQIYVLLLLLLKCWVAEESKVNKVKGKMRQDATFYTACFHIRKSIK